MDMDIMHDVRCLRKYDMILWRARKADRIASSTHLFIPAPTHALFAEVPLVGRWMGVFGPLRVLCQWVYWEYVWGLPAISGI